MFHLCFFQECSHRLKMDSRCFSKPESRLMCLHVLVSEMTKTFFFINSIENIIILCFSSTLSMSVKQYLLQNLVSENSFILIQSPSTLLGQSRFSPTKGFLCLP